MMSYEDWLDCIVAAAENIASEAFQREAWSSGPNVFSSPDELYQVLMEDCTFDLFFETYGKSFRDEQLQFWDELRRSLGSYYDKLPRSPNPTAVVNDSKWHAVRRIAADFVRAFKRN